jgi:histidinol phosphatase-like enzyme
VLSQSKGHNVVLIINRRGAGKKYCSAAKMRKINNYIKLFFAPFAYFAAKEVFKVFSVPLR